MRNDFLQMICMPRIVDLFSKQDFHKYLSYTLVVTTYGTCQLYVAEHTSSKCAHLFVLRSKNYFGDDLMNTTSYFSVTSEDINRFSDEKCVEIFGRMLLADAALLGIPTTAVKISYESSIPDKGIDARVSCCIPQESGGGNLIVGNNPSYQIKAGKTFKPWQQSDINKELFGNSKEQTRDNLKSEIRECFENDGTYILVCMKTEITPNRERTAKLNIENAAKKCGCLTPKVKIWGRNDVLNYINSFPALALYISGRDGEKIKSHSTWGQHPDMQRPLKSGPKHNAIIKKIQDVLRRKVSKPTHINVYGETGVGKTRLVLEATKTPDLKPFVIYCDSPQYFSRLPLNEIDNSIISNAIIIVDDCLQNEIWDRVRGMRSSIKLVTIANEKIQIPYVESTLEIPPLDDSAIKEILLGYELDSLVAGKLTSLCGGIPRFAHILGRDAQQNTSNVSYNLDDIITRYIGYGLNEQKKSAQYNQRELMLLTFSLFKRFGISSYFANERDAMLQLIQKLDHNISNAFFSDTIKKLQDRKILQGAEIAYLTPKFLHVLLWTKWWGKYGTALNIDDIIRDLPHSLAESFFEMFEYSTHSPIAQSILKRFFDKSDSPLRDSDVLKTTSGSKLFDALSKTSPTDALRYLENTLKDWTDSDLLGFTNGRRHVIYGLKHIMLEPDLFERGGKILRRLAEAENESWDDNATNMFCDMFSLSTGYLSSTRAAPQDRLPLLRDTLCSQNQSRRSLGLAACKSALAIKTFSISSFANDDLNMNIKGWEPENEKQLQESYVAVIEMMHDKMKTFLISDERRATAKIILDASRQLMHELPSMTEYLIDKMSDFRSIAGDSVILSIILEIIEFDREIMKPAMIAKLEMLNHEIEGCDYDSHMRRYVMMDTMVDMLARRMERSRIENIKPLAAESADASKLRRHLKWLVTDDAKNGNMFGYELYLNDSGDSLLSDILEAQRCTTHNGSGFFLSGYMRGMFEKSTDRWNRTMHKIAEDEKLRRYFVEISCRSGITDEIGMLIVNLVNEKTLSIDDLVGIRPVFPSHPSLGIVREWIQVLIKDGKPASINCSLVLFRLLYENQEMTDDNDAELAMQLLTHPVLFDDSGESASALYPSVGYNYGEIASQIIKYHREDSHRLCSVILEQLDTVTTTPMYHWMLTVLDIATATSPNDMWNIVIPFLEKKTIDVHGSVILRWMCKCHTDNTYKNSLLAKVKSDRILDWIAIDSDHRAQIVSYHVPPLLSQKSLAMKLICIYGENKKVHQNILSSFMKRLFSDQELYTHKQAVVKYQKETSGHNKHLDCWLDSYLNILNEHIANIAILEERLST